MTHEILFVAGEQLSAPLTAALRSCGTVAVTATLDTAREYLRRVKPGLVIIDMELLNGSTGAMCREAKSLDPSAAVLVTASAAESVPEALEAGCDAVLLKPFAPNLFFARVGRLLRARTNRARVNTHRVWPDVRCPHCEYPGATSFEFASHRRAWYACPSCRGVWVGPLQ